MNADNIIFDVTRRDWKYKGILFAEGDNKEMDKHIPIDFPLPKDFVVGCMAMIWEDEKGDYYGKMRLKFPSGSKKVITIFYAKSEFKSITAILQDLYKFPMIKKAWYSNPTEDPDGMMAILEKSDMIESRRYIDKDGNETEAPPTA